MKRPILRIESGLKKIGVTVDVHETASACPPQAQHPAEKIAAFATDHERKAALLP
jgi:hypothetical protein